MSQYVAVFAYKAGRKYETATKGWRKDNIGVYTILSETGSCLSGFGFTYTARVKLFDERKNNEDLLEDLNTFAGRPGWRTVCPPIEKNNPQVRIIELSKETFSNLTTRIRERNT
tara:strand:+ start:58 stop:399 length:342 start_codon:yes stop_codon:yes gene_type:complete